MGVRCFLIQVTDQVDRQLRRYSKGELATPCPKWGSFHNADVHFDVVHESTPDYSSDSVPHDDPRWPKQCECGYVFLESDNWQMFCEHLWKRETGELMTLRDAPPGAMYDADWLRGFGGHCGPDGKSLMVKLPDGVTWHIDGRASNCGRPDDDVHKCWVRHGEPPMLTVDKNGDTCAAGAGSIMGKTYHGFLRDGELTDA